MFNNIKAMLFISLCCSMANANSSIIVISDDRYIDHSYSSGPYTPTSPYEVQALPYPAYSDGWWAWEAGAFQDSTLSSTAMSGTGSTYAGFDAYNYGAYGTSVFSVTFEVDVNSVGTLDGSLDSNWFDSYLAVSLKENGTEIYGLDSYSMSSPFEIFNQSISFDAGKEYQLVLSSTSYDSDYYDETWSFNLAVAPVPVPAAVWLFGSGLIGLIGLARRKKA